MGLGVGRAAGFLLPGADDFLRAEAFQGRRHGDFADQRLGLGLNGVDLGQALLVFPFQAVVSGHPPGSVNGGRHHLFRQQPGLVNQGIAGFFVGHPGLVAQAAGDFRSPRPLEIHQGELMLLHFGRDVLLAQAFAFLLVEFAQFDFAVFQAGHVGDADHPGADFEVAAVASLVDALVGGGVERVGPVDDDDPVPGPVDGVFGGGLGIQLVA